MCIIIPWFLGPSDTGYMPPKMALEGKQANVEYFSLPVLLVSPCVVALDHVGCDFPDHGAKFKPVT